MNWCEQSWNMQQKLDREVIECESNKNCATKNVFYKNLL